MAPKERDQEAKHFSTNPEKSVVYFYCEASSLLHRGFPIFVGAVNLGIVPPRNFMRIEIPPGNYRFNFKRHGPEPLSVHLEPGELYYFQYEVGINGALFVGELRSMPEDKGRKAVLNSSLIEVPEATVNQIRPERHSESESPSIVGSRSTYTSGVRLDNLKSLLPQEDRQ